MERNTIRTTIVLGILSILGIIIFQVYIFTKNLSLKERQLNQSIHITLRSVAEILSKYNNTILPYENVVYQYSSNYFVVNVNDIIDAGILEHYLIKEFKKRNLNLDFEYAIYDCHTDKMVYGNHVNLSDKNLGKSISKTLPKYDDYVYYFGIYFPSKERYLLLSLGFWYVFVIILIVLILFFGYSQFVIMKQKQLSEIQKDFIDNLTHEFKTPLSSLKLSADVLSDTQIIHEPKRLFKYAGIVSDQTLNLINKVNKVLLVSGDLNSRGNTKMEHFDFIEFINYFKNTYEEIVEKNQGIFKLHLNSSKILVRGNREIAKNIFANLLDNSIKYTEKPPIIEIFTRYKKNLLEISFRDNGIGIPYNLQKKIFDRFYRIHTGNIHNIKGFGLGLNYVKRAVKLQGWKINLESTLGDGSNFVFLVPLFKQKTTKRKK